VPNDIEAVRIEPLGEHHLLEAFSCTHEGITGYATGRCRKDHGEYRVRVRVAVEGDDPAVLGFYSLVISSLVPMTITGRIGRKFGRKREIPAVYLAAVATHEDHDKKGVGAKLMLDALKRTLEIADRAGTACMTLDAVDEKLAEWYGKLEFERFGTTPAGKVQMYLPIWKIEAAIPRAEISVCC